MTVLGRGDLAPRRRARRRGRRVLALLVIATLAVAGWFGWRWWQDRGEDKVTVSLPTCDPHEPPPAPADPKAIRLSVLNGTRRDGLAHEAMVALRKRGFQVTRAGNTKRTAATTIVATGPDHAWTIAVAEQVPKVTISERSSTSYRLTLVLGRDFQGLATEQRVAVARQRDTAAASPSPTPCASPS